MQLQFYSNEIHAFSIKCRRVIIANNLCILEGPQLRDLLSIPSDFLDRIAFNSECFDVGGLSIAQAQLQKRNLIKDNHALASEFELYLILKATDSIKYSNTVLFYDHSTCTYTFDSFSSTSILRLEPRIYQSESILIVFCRNQNRFLIRSSLISEVKIDDSMQIEEIECKEPTTEFLCQPTLGAFILLEVEPEARFKSMEENDEEIILTRKDGMGNLFVNFHPLYISANAENTTLDKWTRRGNCYSKETVRWSRNFMNHFLAVYFFNNVMQKENHEIITYGGGKYVSNWSWEDF